MKRKQKVIAIFIAYNAEKTLAEFYKNFPKLYFDDIILVDDVSKDNTFNLARKLGIKSFQNPVNLGYGGNLKRAICIALKLGGDILVDIHPDGEYSPSAIPDALYQIQQGGAEFVMGNRFISLFEPLKHGMYRWKLLPIILFNAIDRMVLGVKIDDFHQGFRVYTRQMLGKIRFLETSNDFLFSLEIIAQAAFHRIKFAQVPVKTNYSGKKRGITFRHGIVYSFKMYKTLFSFIMAKLGLKIKMFQEPQGKLEDYIAKVL